MHASSPRAMQLAWTTSWRAVATALHTRSVVLSMAQKGVRAMGSALPLSALWLRTMLGQSVARPAVQAARVMVPRQPSPVLSAPAVGQYTQGRPVQSASRGGICLAGLGAGTERFRNRRSGCSM